MSIPYVAFDGVTLRKCPPIEVGGEITCFSCGKKHRVEKAPDSELLLVYTCGGELYLAGVAGRNIIGVGSDESGEVNL